MTDAPCSRAGVQACRRERVIQQWFVGYVIFLFASLPLALPVWNAWLRDSLGRLVTAEQLHVVQYAGLGWLAAWSARAGRAGRGRWRLAWVWVAGIGVMEELCQALVPGRFFQWSDVGLNWIGGGIGWRTGRSSFFVPQKHGEISSHDL